MGGKYDFEVESSSDSDDGLPQEDIAALSLACLPSDDEDDDDDDDLELVRGLKEQYGVDISNPLSLKPLTTLLPLDSEDEEDDFEILSAIQRRFTHYDGASASGGGGGGGGVDRRDGVGAGEADATESKSENCTEKLLPDDATCMNLENESFDVCRNDRGQGPCSTSECGEDISNSTSSFPKAAQTFIEAIKKNRSCQKFLRSKLLHIEARMEEINALKKKIGTLKEYHVACKKKIGRALSQKQDARIQLISAPKQRANAKASEKNISPMLYGPVENSHVANYRASLVSFPQSFQRERWDGSKKDESDSKKLEKGMRQQVQKLLIEKSADILSDLDESGYIHGLDDIMLSVRNFEITPEIMQDFAGKINWDELASIYLPHRSGVECEARWFNHENPLINRDGWTPEEDKQLLLLIQHYGLNNWSLIAEMLKKNRTPFQCLARYQRSLNASILKREWTEDEDAQLRSAVESFGESNWQVVASALEGRTGTQCSNRWNKTLHPTRQRVGKWSDDEDKRLKVAVTLFGQKNWYRIAEFVPGRTQAQCRERWVNVLDPSLNRGPWTGEEDEKLKAAIMEHGYCWSRIATCVPSRTDNQCRRRWKRLFPHEVPLLQAAKRIQKVALISNFVDRESERPALGPSDFAPLCIEGPVNEPTNEPTNDNPPKGQQSRKSRKSDLGRKLALCCTSKNAQSRKPRKRAKSPEIEMLDDKAQSRKRTKRVKSPEAEMVNDKAQSRKRRKRAKSPEVEMPRHNCVAQSNNGGRILITYQRRKFRKSVSKEIIPTGSINIAAEPTLKPTNPSREVQSTECRKRARSPMTDMSSDMTDAGQSDVGDTMKNNRREARKSGSKKRKYSMSTDIGRDYSKQSTESQNSDDTTDMSWDLPIKIRSRRARGVSSKKIATLNAHRAPKATCMDDANENVTASNPSEENYDPAMQHDEPMCSNSPESGVGDDLEAQIPCMDHVTREQSHFIQKPEKRTSNEIDQEEDGSSVGDSVTSACNIAENHFKGDSKSSKRKLVKRRHKQNKLESEESEKWEDLPLAALLGKSAGFKKRR